MSPSKGHWTRLLDLVTAEAIIFLAGSVGPLEKIIKETLCLSGTQTEWKVTRTLLRVVCPNEGKTTLKAKGNQEGNEPMRLEFLTMLGMFSCLLKLQSAFVNVLCRNVSAG